MYQVLHSLLRPVCAPPASWLGVVGLAVNVTACFLSRFWGKLMGVDCMRLSSR